MSELDKIIEEAIKTKVEEIFDTRLKQESDRVIEELIPAIDKLIAERIKLHILELAEHTINKLKEE